MPENSKATRKAYYQSICDVRIATSLGCKNCMLKGYKECPKSEGTETSFMVNQNKNNIRHSKDFGGYKCYLNIDFH